MTRDVVISISGAQFSEGDQEDVELITTGDYFLKTESIISYMMRSKRTDRT